VKARNATYARIQIAWDSIHQINNGKPVTIATVSFPRKSVSIIIKQNDMLTVNVVKTARMILTMYTVMNAKRIIVKHATTRSTYKRNAHKNGNVSDVIRTCFERLRTSTSVVLQNARIVSKLLKPKYTNVIYNL
jgi:hypothetical protein